MKYLYISAFLLAALSSFSAYSETQISLSDEDRDAITRVAISEASNQGEGGLSAVIWVILNRYKDSGFGDSITDVVNAKNQFEPVTRVKTWKALPKPSERQYNKVNTIINLALSGYFADPTKGALYFQNPEIVKSREAAGKASKGLTHFGGSKPTITIKDHAFYKEVKLGQQQELKEKKIPIKGWDVFNNSAYKINVNNLKTW
jgi:spore germination cell wall hydrolase CwlJ-like protein